MSQEGQAAIEMRGVTKRFGARTILDRLDLRVEVGETIVVVGKSGTGKSVTLKHLVGLLTPDAGEVLVGGSNIAVAKGQELQRLRRKFGFLFQSGALINWMTLERNVALPLIEHTRLSMREIREQVHAVLSRVGLEAHAQVMPAMLSGGMRKRAGLARAIITRPEIILYDEPTSGLDPVMSRQVDELIRQLQKELSVTSIVVTHDLVSAFGVGDRVVMLDQGRVVEDAPPSAFRRSKNAMVQEFIKAQFGGISNEVSA